MKPKEIVLVERCPACRDSGEPCKECGGSGVGLRCVRCRKLWGSARVGLVVEELMCASCFWDPIFEESDARMAGSVSGPIRYV